LTRYHYNLLKVASSTNDGLFFLPKNVSIWAKFVCYFQIIEWLLCTFWWLVTHHYYIMLTVWQDKVWLAVWNSKPFFWGTIVFLLMLATFQAITNTYSHQFYFSSCFPSLQVSAWRYFSYTDFNRIRQLIFTISFLHTRKDICFFQIEFYQLPRKCINPKLNQSCHALASFLFQTNF